MASVEEDSEREILSEGQLVQYSFSDATEEYITHIKSLVEILPLVMELLSIKVAQESDQIDFFIKENNIQEIDEDEKIKIRIPSEKFKEFVNLNDKVKITSLAIDFIPVNFFVSFVSQYDAYLSDLIKIIFKIKPELLNDSEKTMKFSELMGFHNMEEAKEYIIEKEVSSIMRESHVDQFKWLERKLKMELRKDLPSFKEFVEITERRNLLVHANGLVSRHYKQVCGENGVDNINKVKVGSKLRITPQYLARSYSVMFEIGVKLGQVLWRKIQSDINNLGKADIALNSICYDLMLEKRYKLSVNLLSFATDTLKKHSDQETVYTFIINKALSHYLNNDKEESKRILDKTDWSATSDKFKLALAVLQEDYDKAAYIMTSIGSTNMDVSKKAYGEWPLFTDFRKSEIFKLTYNKVFGEDFLYVEDKPKRLADIISHKKQIEEISTDSNQETVG